MTTQQAHTPGPWTVGAHHYVTAGSFTFAPASNGAPVAEWEANARLIAAAPDLLAALRAVLAEWVNGRKVGEGISMPVATFANAAMSKAAISKATSA